MLVLNNIFYEAPTSIWFDPAHYPELVEGRSGYLLLPLRLPAGEAGRERNPSYRRHSLWRRAAEARRLTFLPRLTVAEISSYSAPRVRLGRFSVSAKGDELV